MQPTLSGILPTYYFTMFNFFRKASNYSEYPTVFHLTHHKAGSQWVLSVLKAAAPGRVVEPQPKGGHIMEGNLQAGNIYPTIYLSRQEFEAALSKSDLEDNVKVFYIHRDLRDTLVSLYFSLRNTHKVYSPHMQKLRSTLENLDKEEGMLLLLNKNLKTEFEIQNSWVGSDVNTYRYEDIIQDEQNFFSEIRSLAELDIDENKYREIVKNNSFKSVSGRKAGEEDITKHQRKGIAGDWRNHFTDKIKNEFKRQYNHLLIETGYEKDDNW